MIEKKELQKIIKSLIERNKYKVTKKGRSYVYVEDMTADIIGRGNVLYDPTSVSFFYINVLKKLYPEESSKLNDKYVLYIGNEMFD